MYIYGSHVASIYGSHATAIYGNHVTAIYGSQVTSIYGSCVTSPSPLCRYGLKGPVYLRDKNGRVAQPDPTHSDKGVIFASGMIETAKHEQLDHNTYIALLPRDFEHLHFVSKHEEGRLGDLVMCTID